MVTSRITAMRVGTRGSALALAQTALALEAILRQHPTLEVSVHIIKTTGDQVIDVPLTTIAGLASGVFTSALESALLDGQVDLAVHSAKDVPTELSPGLTLAAYLHRADVRDVIISRQGYTLHTLPPGAIVGTSSPRRAAQLRFARSDLQIHNLRGNIDTRIGKALSMREGYDAIVLAKAGLERLKRTDVISETLSLDVMLPAPAQGAIALQVRDSEAWVELLASIDHRQTHASVTAERAFLRGLGGGCALPVAAYAEVVNDTLHLRGRVLTLDGMRRIDAADYAPLGADWSASAEALGYQVATRALDQGAAAWIEVTR